jgi:predicted GIY-YIG superfamily endonuclease
MTNSEEMHEDAAHLTSFEKWIPLLSLSVGDLPRHGNISIVYAMRSAATDEIVYIGSSNNLRRRILGNYIGGVGGETTQRVHELLFWEGQIAKVEVAWIETGSYKETEEELKQEYGRKYGRLPKWNKL